MEKQEKRLTHVQSAKQQRQSPLQRQMTTNIHGRQLRKQLYLRRQNSREHALYVVRKLQETMERSLQQQSN